MPLLILFVLMMSLIFAVALSAKIYGDQNARPRELEEALRAGEATMLRVRVVTDHGERVRLGTSREVPPIVSSDPSLDTEEVVLEEVRDDALRPRRFRLPPGQGLKVVHLPGAVREQVYVETTEEGVAHCYSFDVGADTPFWLVARVGTPGSSYRDDPTFDLHSHDGGFQAASKREALFWRRFGRGQAALVALGIFGLLAAAGSSFRHGILTGLILNASLYFFIGLSLVRRTGRNEPRPPRVAPPEPTPRPRIQVRGDEARTELDAESEDRAPKWLPATRG